MNLSLFKKSVIFSCIVLSGMFFTSLASSFRPLKTLTPVIGEMLQPLVREADQVSIACQWVSGDESKQIFGHDFPDREVYPLKISIQNNTSVSYSLTAGSIDLPRLTASQVAFKITKSSIPRSIAYRVASLFFWPIAIPSTIDGIRVFAHHQSLKKEIRAKSLKDQEGELILPYSTVSRVLFVDKNHRESSIKVSLIDLDTLEPQDYQIQVDEKPA